MKKITPTLVTLLAAAAPVLAHPGHSHASEAESAAHTLLIVAAGILAAAAVAGTGLVLRRKQG